MDTSIVIAKQENPISAPAKMGLICLIGLLNLLLYLFCAVALLVVGGLIVLDVLLLVVLARVYASRIMLTPLNRLFHLGRVIVRSLRLEEDARYHIVLAPKDALHLFATVKECARRVGCPQPNEVVMMIENTAWVRLEGFRSGQGKSTLGLGYDLLTGLSQEELEAILLHEMAHARLVQRGLKLWTGRTLNRGIQLVRSLGDLEEEPNTEKPGEKPRTFWTAKLLGILAVVIAKAEHKLFASLSRQDEFEADRMAASLCTPQKFCQALLKAVMLDIKGQDIYWVDRMMESQREGSYTDWLRDKMTVTEAKEAQEIRKKAITLERRSEFSSHPTLQDRFAHLGVPLDAPQEGVSMAPPATPVPWFESPDEVIEKLFDHIEQTQAEEERKNTLEMARWERQKRKRRPLSNMQGVGVFLGIVGVIFLLSLFDSSSTEQDIIILKLVLGIAGLIGGPVLYRMGTPAKPTGLPIPEFSLWQESLESLWERTEESDSQERRLVLPMLPFTPPATSKKQELLSFWRHQGHQALRLCDYSTALQCGLQCLQVEKGNADGLLLAGVSYNSLGQFHTGDTFLGQVFTSFSGNPWVNWGIGWACLSCGDWTAAELYLLGAIENLPPHPTLRAALAIAQAQRGKLRSAIENLRRAVAMTPESIPLRLRLAQTMLMAGKIRDTVPLLDAITANPKALAEKDVRLAVVRMHLMLNHKEEADTHTQAIMVEHPEPDTFYRLGLSYAITDHFDEAEGYFYRSTAEALFPAAWVHLGMLHVRAKRKEQARACFLGAINLLQPRAPKADKPLEALQAALKGLRSLADPVSTQFFWEIHLNVSTLPAFELAEIAFLVLAPTQNGAVAYTRELLEAMHPGTLPVEHYLASAKKSEMEPPEEPTPPGVVDWQARRKT